MRILICGDRNWSNYTVIKVAVGRACPNPLPTDVIIDGCARGADTIGFQVGREFGFQAMRFPADWHSEGKAAGPLRNIKMLREGKPDLVLAFHNFLPNSKGTKHMVRIALDAKIPVQVWTTKGQVEPVKVEAWANEIF